MVQALRAAYPQDGVELWTVAEHRLGLKPILRRVGCRRGRRPEALVQPRAQWGYRYAVVHPPSGRTVWWRLPTVSIAAFTVALREFAHAVGTDHGTQILLVGEGAGWHVSAQGQGPSGIHLPGLPPYSPELQPAARLGPLPNEALANRHCQALDALQEGQAPRCLVRQTMPELIRGHTNFHWWPQTA